MRRGGGGGDSYMSLPGVPGIYCIFLMGGDTNCFDIRALPVRGRSGPPPFLMKFIYLPFDATSDKKQKY